MNMLKLSSLLLLLTLLSSCSAMSMLARRRSQHFCGQVLADTIRMICIDGVAGPDDTATTEATIQSNSVGLVARDLFAGPLYKGADVYGYLFRNAPSLYSIPERKAQREKKTGIVEQCCYQPCTLAALSEYCLKK